MRNENRTLREGFTTGTAATAAAMAALTLLLTGRSQRTVSVPLPPIDRAGGPRDWMDIPIAFCKRGLHPDCDAASSGNAACETGHACVIKDGGDDPDATNHAAICASVLLDGPEEGHIPFHEALPHIRLEGGKGVGRVTLPGLPVPVGEWAINPGPRQQIRAGIWHCLAGNIRPVRCIFTVPDGEKIAERTFNPRLGIVGGISILGTQGTVKPFSHEAFIATIREQIAIAEATGERDLFFSTGRRSEKALQKLYPEKKLRAFIQVGDHMGASLSLARGSFRRITAGLFFGKLVKIAQGHLATHAGDCTLDMEALAAMCEDFGVSGCGRDLKSARTARHILETIRNHQQGPAVVGHLVSLARTTMERESACPVTVCLFDTDATLLCRKP